MTPTDLCYTPATKLVPLIRSKKLSPVELMKAVLERIEKLNPKLNAFCTITADDAMKAARAAEQAVMKKKKLGPIHGIPFSIKDLAFTKGVRTMSGSHIFADRIPDHDAPYVRRLKEAGGILTGKTTSPEFEWKALSGCPLTGDTHNPWNLAMNTGGSSASAGSAAAAGLGPLHQGSDGAGSIRVPSSFCGIFGHKPSYGRVPQWPVSNNDYTTHNGPMTRTVGDSALMMSIMAGPDDWDRTSLDAAPEDYVGKLNRGVKGLRVAWSPNLDSLPVDPEVAALVKKAVGAFKELGGKVEEIQTKFADTHDMIRVMWGAHYAGAWGSYLPKWREKMDPGFVACIEDGLRVSVAEYIDMRGKKMTHWDSVRPLFEKYDLLLTPSVSVAAFPLGRLNPEHWPQHAWDWLPWASFSYPFNFTGQPACSLPAGFTRAGLPVGLQVVGRRFADLTVLQAAAAFEKARPWEQKRPEVD